MVRDGDQGIPRNSQKTRWESQQTCFPNGSGGSKAKNVAAAARRAAQAAEQLAEAAAKEASPKGIDPKLIRLTGELGG